MQDFILMALHADLKHYRLPGVFPLPAPLACSCGCAAWRFKASPPQLWWILDWTLQFQCKTRTCNTVIETKESLSWSNLCGYTVNFRGFSVLESKRYFTRFTENPINQIVPLCGRAGFGFREKNKWVLNKHQRVDTSFPHWLVVEAGLEVCGHNPIKQENNHVDCVTKFLN